MTPGHAYLRRHRCGRIELENEWPVLLLVGKCYLDFDTIHRFGDEELILIDLANASACYRIVDENDLDEYVCELQFGTKDHEATPFVTSPFVALRS